MPVINIDENITQLRNQIDKLTQELYRMHGVLQTFEGFKKGGLEKIDLPIDPSQSPVEELESVQEKPE